MKKDVKSPAENPAKTDIEVTDQRVSAHRKLQGWITRRLYESSSLHGLLGGKQCI